MRARRARRSLLVFAALFAVAVTWPGIVPANRFRPTLFGLPFTLVWVGLWIVIGFVVLLGVDRKLHDGEARSDDTGRR
jgi:hypothetical protein